jgi:hypothetical protein
MITTFKTGDKLICIEAAINGHGEIMLKEGQEYTVTKIETSAEGHFIYVDNINFGWNPRRFKEKVDRCVCSTRDLMMCGCKCGQMERERH